jgi:uncharacterized membrane protein YeiH
MLPRVIRLTGVDMPAVTPSVTEVLDLLGIFVFAISGALLGVRRGFDVIGLIVLAESTALGGGILRDLIIGATPPAAFVQTTYLVTPILAAALTFFVHRQINRINSAMLIFDAGGLGLFTVAGTVKALAYGLGPVQAVALGVTTAVGGGILRDVLANEVPTILRPDSELYVTPALVASTVVAVAWSIEGENPLVAILAALVAFALRLAALHYGWRAPRAWRTSAPARSAPGCAGERRELPPP